MKFKIEKNLRILNELITYCYSFGVTEIQSNMKQINSVSLIYVKCKIPNFPKNELDNLNLILNTPRQHEMEEYYWHLGGESEIDSELSLVGMMIDSFHISYKNEILEIEVFRE